MINYVKREMPDLNGSGESKCYYKIKSKGNISSEDLVEKIAHPGSGLSKGSVVHVLQSLSEEISHAIASGYSVTLPGIGIFKASIGLREGKEMDSLNEDEEQRNAASIKVRGINYIADKGFVNKTDNKCHMSRGGIERVHHSPFTKAERLELAVNYLSNPTHTFMRVSDYMKMTGLSKSVAALELKEFAESCDNNISYEGIRASKLYLIKPTQELTS